MAVAKEMMYNAAFKANVCDITAEGNLNCNGTSVEVAVSGEKPDGGELTFGSGSVTELTLMYGTDKITRQDGELVHGEPEVKLASGLYDAEGNLIATWNELVNNYGIDLERKYINSSGSLVVEESEFPMMIISASEKLKKGTKLVVDDSVKYISHFALASDPSVDENLKEVIIGKGITSIGTMSFVTSKIEKITIGKNVVSIGDDAFSGCNNLIEVIIPDNVTSLGKRAFRRSENLQKVTLGKGITSIGERTFDECTSLKEITIPNSLKSIGRLAFDSCESLKTINYTGTQTEWNSITFDSEWNSGMPNDYIINYN